VTVTGEATPLGTIGAGPDWQTVPNTRPTVSSPRPAPGSKVRDTTPLLSAVVRDKETDLQTSDVKLYVDGRSKPFSYSLATDKLTHRSAKLKPGSHTVKVVVTDAGDLTTTNSWNFKVVR
jgi:hypothetical protein